MPQYLEFSETSMCFLMIFLAFHAIANAYATIMQSNEPTQYVQERLRLWKLCARLRMLRANVKNSRIRMSGIELGVLGLGIIVLGVAIFG